MGKMSERMAEIKKGKENKERKQRLMERKRVEIERDN